MCLILFALDQRPDLPLVVAANRDEFHGRATAPLHRWHDLPVVAGRDLQAGGTWLGISRVGGVLRFAAVTNYREGPLAAEPPLSRGALVSGFLAGTDGNAMDWLARVQADGDQYRGFNLLVAELGPDGHPTLGYLCNRTGEPPRHLTAGVYGLANDALDVPWPKVERGKAALAAALDTAEPPTAACLDLLGNCAPPPEHELHAQGLTSDIERRTSPVFIEDNHYGTRASSVVLGGPAGLNLLEQSWLPNGRAGVHRRHHLVAGA